MAVTKIKDAPTSLESIYSCRCRSSAQRGRGSPGPEPRRVPFERYELGAQETELIAQPPDGHGAACHSARCAPLALQLSVLHAVLTSRSEGEQADGEPEHVPDNYGLQSYWNESYAEEAYGHLYDWCAAPSDGARPRRSDPPFRYQDYRSLQPFIQPHIRLKHSVLIAGCGAHRLMTPSKRMRQLIIAHRRQLSVLGGHVSTGLH